MADHDTTLADLRQRVAEFVAARDWEQYHVPKNLSVSVAVEAAELMEHFQWLTHEQAAAAMQDDERRAAVVEELADVLIYALSLANVLNVDLSAAIVDKLAQNERRFPVAEWRGQARGIKDESSRTAG
jgi:NTP pyrophosphatase (non-canonical NTP hydrolase)